MRLWGRKSSINVLKVLWCLAELDLHEGIHFERTDAGLQFGIVRSPEFLKLNPNGLVPTLEDGDIVQTRAGEAVRGRGGPGRVGQELPAPVRRLPTDR